ncbi:hypothetical protein Cgig2_025405 [Carnegiea gigantea]|uniref:Uncharacterized protein n=1 Tax=Carnegiea gigantea TaxID=171969 RepID=A0A9Q1K0C4_9CARY|nr:hypothetical protein Cgig2_025405 [Carnegiea gigantea]
MGGSGYEFTWWNGQGGEGSVEERLDHFCANTEWSSLFPDATHIDCDLLDHLPILLKSKPTQQRKAATKVFRFEDMWAFDPSCLETIKHAWSSCTEEDESSSWGAEFIRNIFMPHDTEAILDLPLSDSWLGDKLIWHFTQTWEFSVRSAYHMLVDE